MTQHKTIELTYEPGNRVAIEAIEKALRSLTKKMFVINRDEVCDDDNN